MSDAGGPGGVFSFRFAPSYQRLSWVFGITPRTAEVTVRGGMLRARFGPWHVTTPLANIKSTEITGPYSYPKTAGPAHLSFSDRGLTFATNGEEGVCLTFHEAVKGMEPTGRLRHPNLTLTLEDCAGFRRAVENASG